MEKFVVGTLTKSEIEADPRDIKAEAVLQLPTAQEIANLPKEFRNGAFIGSTYYQNGWGSCTAMGTTHSMLIQNVKELATLNPEIASDIGAKLKAGINPIELDWKDLWKKMGHNLDDKNDSGDYVEKALGTVNKLGIKGKDYNGNEVLLYGLNYANSANYGKDMFRYWLTKYPIVLVMNGNNTIRNEMMAGEVKTVINAVDRTGAHCICADGYTEYGPIIENSRSPNDATKKKCTFTVSWENFAKMVQTGMLNRRYWIEFDKKDATLDLDLYIEENNAIEVLKLINAFYKKTRFADTRKECGEFGATIRKNYPRANLAVPKN